MPVELSTKVVTVEVPSTVPAMVAMASAIRALSPLGSLPSLSSMPALLAVPMRVPTVSKQSQMAKVMMAVSRGKRPNCIKPLKPSVNTAPKVGARAPKPWNTMLSGKVVTPKGMPTMVVAMMPIKMAPLTL